MIKLMLFCLFFGPPICCGEWSGPFWVQMLLALLMFVPFLVVLRRELKNQ